MPRHPLGDYPDKPWQVLGVTKGAAVGDVEAAYARLKKRDLDCGPSGGREQRLARLESARAALLGADGL